MKHMQHKHTWEELDPEALGMVNGGVYVPPRKDDDDDDDNSGGGGATGGW